MKTDTKIRLLTSRAVLFGSLLILSVSVHAAETEVFKTSFEATGSPAWASDAILTSTAVNGWIGNDNGTTLLGRITDTQANTGSQSLRLYDNINGNSASARYDLGDTLTQGYIEFSIKQASGGNFYIYLSDTGTDATNFYLSLSNARVVNLNGQASATPDTSTYTVTGWNTFRIYFDETTNTASVSLNGTSIVSIATGDADATKWQVGKIRLQAGASASQNTGAWFDDIRIVNTATPIPPIPEPSTHAILAGLGTLVLALARGWRRQR
ncbi:MAG: DUF1080 domain-containing protein [Opitutaceae bacterium]|jgi:hypothetical protein|nr:DUF1080 domain-containing protein [Opitutaceae bacterium]